MFFIYLFSIFLCFTFLSFTLFKSSRNRRYLVLPFGLGLSLHLVFNFLLNLTIYTKISLDFYSKDIFFIYIKIPFLGFQIFILGLSRNSVSRISDFYIGHYLKNSVSRILFFYIAVMLFIIS